MYWSLGSNIMEPGLQYIGAYQIFVLQNRLVGLKYFFAITQMRFNKMDLNICLLIIAESVKM